MKEESIDGIIITIPILLMALVAIGFLGSQFSIKHEPNPIIDVMNEQLKDCDWVLVTEEWSNQQFLAPKCDGQILYWDAQTNQLTPKDERLTIHNLGDTLSLPAGIVKDIREYHDWCLENHYVWVMPIGSNFAHCEKWNGERVYND